MARVKNNYFQFKQFKVVQEFSAMRVSTDACIFGAFVAQELQKLNPSHVLDIGAGTGLLSLMVAQKNIETKIDAVEIDKAACQDADLNFKSSTFSDRLQLFSTSVQNYNSETLYDVIISNPPFFLQSLKNPVVEKSMARHADISLTMDDLFHEAQRLNHPEGFFITIYPFDSQQHQMDIAEKYGYHLRQSTRIKSYLESTPHCVINFWCFDITDIDVENFVIYDTKGVYTTQFSVLLADYYLHL